MQRLYFDITEGKIAKYRKWLTPVYGKGKASISKTSARKGEPAPAK
jgi:hypothetical protein